MSSLSLYPGWGPAHVDGLHAARLKTLSSRTRTGTLPLGKCGCLGLAPVYIVVVELGWFCLNRGCERRDGCALAHERCSSFAGERAYVIAIALPYSISLFDGPIDFPIRLHPPNAWPITQLDCLAGTVNIVCPESTWTSQLLRSNYPLYKWHRVRSWQPDSLSLIGIWIYFIFQFNYLY